MRAIYKKQADERKYKHRLAVRHQNRNSIEVLDSMNEYGKSFLAMYTDDPVLYTYQRKLKSELQWEVLKGLPVGIMFAFLPLTIAR